MEPPLRHSVVLEAQGTRRGRCLRDEDGVDEVLRGQVRGARLPAPERWVEVAAVQDGLGRRLHLSRCCDHARTT